MNAKSKFVPPYNKNAKLKSSDVNDIIDLSLQHRDEQWFQELVQKKETLTRLEKDARHELGFNGIY